MNETQLMRQYTLFQKSWTGYSTCSHGTSASKPGTVRPIIHKSGYQRDPRSKLENGMTVTKYTTESQSTDPPPIINSNNVGLLPPLRKGRFSPATNAPPRAIHRSNSRKDKPLKSNTKPWRETPPKLSDNTNKRIELHYNKNVPKQKWLEYKPRQYVSNHKYGSIYEMRKDVTDHKEPVPPPSSWLWEEEYRIWRLDEKRPPPRTFSKRGFSQRKLGKLSVDKPHAELFAAYHSHRLDKQKRQRNAVIIQRHVRGWLVRKKLTELKRQVLRGLSLSWSKFVSEYKGTVTRIQSRYGIMKTECKFDLKQVQDFVERRERCERVYDKMVGYGGKLKKYDLPEFFRLSGLYPTEAEITKAFNTIYRGPMNTAEVVFVMDCSASLGPINFQNQLNFVKDVILGFEIAPDRVRIGLVPFNENVFNSFGLTQFQTKEGLLETIENLKHKPGLTRTDLALKMMRQIFKSSRPGVQKIALVITDGKSSDPGPTLREAKLAREENIEIFAIGVGYTVDADELQAIAGDETRVKTCTDYSSIGQLNDLVKERICLGSGQAGGLAKKAEPGLKDVCRLLTRDEVIEILWTIYPPEAANCPKRISTWIRPIVDGQEAWSLLDEKIMKKTDYKQCLRFVIQSKLERDGYMEIPVDLRLGVERVTSLEEALEKVETYLEMKDKEKLEGELRRQLTSKDTVHKDSFQEEPVRVQILKIDHHDNVESSDITSADILQYKHHDYRNVDIITFSTESPSRTASTGSGDSSVKIKSPEQEKETTNKIKTKSALYHVNSGGYTDQDSLEDEDVSDTESLEMIHEAKSRKQYISPEDLVNVGKEEGEDLLDEDSIEAAEAGCTVVVDDDDDTDKSIESTLSRDSLNFIPTGSQNKASQTEQSLKTDTEKDRIKFESYIS